MKMYISSLFLSSFLAFATPTIINGATTQGSLTLRSDVSSNFFVSTCSSDAVTIEGNNDGSLKPGFILAQMDEINTNNCDDTCSFLFRKIVSDDGDGTYSTTLATFSEVFPTEIYDESLADITVESMFECEGEGQQHQKYLRMLQTTATDAPTETVTSIICEVYPYLGIVATVVTVLAAIIPFLVPVVPFLIPITILVSLIFAATGTCGVTWENFLSTLLGSVRDAGISVRSEVVGLLYGEDASTQAPGGARLLVEKLPFHASSNEWMAVSGDGKCKYADCNVGSDGNASTCFSKGLVTDDFNFDGMINMNKVVSTKDRDFVNAFHVQDYCYASSSFEKDVCDSNTYKALVNTCQESQTTNSQLTTFPLALTDTSNDCLAMSLLFTIGANNFGENMYSEKREMQLKHNKEDVCSEMIATIM